MSSEETLRDILALPKTQQRKLIAQSFPEITPLLQLIDLMEKNADAVTTILMNMDRYKNQLESQIMNLYKSKSDEVKSLNETINQLRKEKKLFADKDLKHLTPLDMARGMILQGERDFEKIQKETGLKKNQIAGIMGQLAKKGLIKKA